MYLIWFITNPLKLTIEVFRALLAFRQWIPFSIILWLVLSAFTASAKEKFTLAVLHTDTSYNLNRLPYKTKFRDSADIPIETASLVNWLLKKDFLLANIDSLTRSEMETECYIYTGPRFHKASIRTCKSLIQALLYANVAHDKPLTLSQYKKAKRRILAYYENHGFPFAQIYLDSVSISGDSINAALKCKTFKKWEIAEINISGNVTIKDDFIHKQINITPGDAYSEQLIEAIPERLGQLDFLQLASPPEVQFHRIGHAVLKLNLQKQRANTFDGIVGFGPDKENSSNITVTGNINFNLHNTLKKGEHIKMEWEKVDRYSQNAYAQTYFKYLWKTRIGTGAEIAIEKQDTSFLNIEIQGNADYFSKGNASSGIQISQRQNNLLNDQAYDTIAGKLNVLQAKTILAGIQLKYLRLDYKQNPSKGFAGTINVNTGTKRYFQTPSVPDSIFAQFSTPSDVYELEAQGQLFIPIQSPLIGMLGASGKWFYAGELFDNELYRIGGANSLRGFSEQALPASAYAIATAEARLLFDKNSNLYAFFDQAYYIQETETVSTSGFPFGFGFGMNIASKNSIFRISYAVGKQDGEPIAFSRGKIHFGYTNRF